MPWTVKKIKKIKTVVPVMGIGSYLLLHCLQLFFVEAGETFQLLLLPFQLFSLEKRKKVEKEQRAQ